MMYSKLAMRNLRRNSKDYGVYALTVVLSVALFYSFNAVSQQKSFLMLIGSSSSLAMITQALSIILTAILAALIIYANRFLVRRRQRELGVYVSLGMEQGKISQMFCLETIGVGACALAGGILLGVGLAQVFAILICRMFGVDIANLAFTFSTKAVLFTLLVFTVTFVLVALFNFLTISRFTLLELLYGGRKNEKKLLAGRRAPVLVLSLSVILVALGYAGILTQGAQGMGRWQFKAGIALTAVGTLLFYLSVPALVTGVLARRKAFCYQGIRLFSLRQLGSKLSMNSILLGCLAIAITISIGGFSFGMAMRQSMIDSVDSQTPFDVQFSMYSQKGAPLMEEYNRSLEQKGYQYKTRVEIDRLQLDQENHRMRFADLLGGEAGEMIQKNDKELWDLASRDLSSNTGDSYTTLTAVSLSGVNRYLAAKGQPALALQTEEYLFIGTHLSEQTQSPVTGLLEPVTIGGREYRSAKAGDISGAARLVNAIGYYIIVLPDNAAAVLPVSSTMTFVDLNRSLSAADARELAGLEERAENQGTAGETDNGMRKYFAVDTRAENIAFAQENGAMITFIGLYVGTVFMIIVAAVLALQQLVNAAEQRGQYQILEKLGARESRLRRTVLSQIGTYFATPMLLGFLNGGLVTWIWNDWIFSMNGGSQSTRTLYEIVALGIAAFLVVYALYFVLTYAIYKRTVLKSSR